MTSILSEHEQEAKRIVDGWADYWQKQQRLNGSLDRFAKADLIDRVTLALAEASPPDDTSKPTATGRKKKAEANG